MSQEAFTILNFSDVEKFDVYKVCAALLHMGEMSFKQRPREEQAEPDDTKGSAASSMCKRAQKGA